MTGACPELLAADDTAWVGENLLGQLLRFGQMLRLMGVRISLRQTIDLARALEYVPITQKLDFYCAAQALLVTRREDLPVFDQAFEIFWRSIRPSSDEQTSSEKPRPARLPGQPDDSGPDQARGEARAGARSGEEEWINAAQTARYSPLEILRHKDFGQMTWEEIQAAKRAIVSLDWRLAERKTRRFHRGTRGRLDLRRIMRQSLPLGGEILNLSYRTYAFRPRPLVVLCDVSGSMDRYSRMLLQFIHAFMHGLTNIDLEAFVFGTRLTRITHHLRHKDVDRAMDEVGTAVLDWAGGTRIGEAIRSFNFQWARRVLGRSAVVLIISDGWDRGDVELLTRELARLQRSAYRLMWLNPLLGMGDYAPRQRGMAAALAYVDDLLPGGNLAGLEQLAQVLSGIPIDRPTRRQHPRFPNREQPAGKEQPPGLDEHPFVKVVNTYPWLNVFSDLGRMNNGESRSQ